MTAERGTALNVKLYPWFRFCHGLIFWQAIWFLYFQNALSAAEAILLYAVFDVSATALEVPLGYMSDRVGRKVTLFLSGVAGALAALMMALGSTFEMFALANILLGAWAALLSGTDSAFLFESLAAENREDEVEAHELLAWRFSFTALAISAATGGIMAAYAAPLPYFAVAVALIVSSCIALLFWEAPKGENTLAGDTPSGTMQAITLATRKPILIWLFALSVLMYIYSHIPFIFGQPFILEALAERGLNGEAPIISGAVSAVMMLLSVIVSLFAMKIRGWLGLAPLLIFAFFIQVALVGVLALTNSMIAIVFLFLRMVPDSLSRPFILARIQPELSDQTRATYLSLQSFCGRLIFAATLFFASNATSNDGPMAFAEIQRILGWYVFIGFVSLVGLALVARRMDLENNGRH